MLDQYILLVDDDPELLQLHNLYLTQAGYKTLCATDGVEAMAHLERHLDTLSLIISDIVMPNMDGYELCRKVRTDYPGYNFPFIFVSGLTTLEEKLQGYAAGGDDYITKPIEPEILHEKTKLLIDIQKNNSEIKLRLSESFSTAMQAMTYSSQLGKILEFFKRSIQAHTIQELTSYLFDFTESLGLRTSIQYHLRNETISFGDRGEISPLERNVIEMARTQSRFFDFGARTIINYDDFSLLIKNMPLDDKELYGTLKDTLGNLCEAVEARVKVLLSEDRSKQREIVLQTIEQAMEQLSESLVSIQAQNVHIIENMINDIDNAMLSLGLTEVQEENIRQIATDTMNNIEQAFIRSDVLKEEFKKIQTTLTSLLSV